jgi:hypothetical protein
MNNVEILGCNMAFGTAYGFCGLLPPQSLGYLFTPLLMPFNALLLPQVPLNTRTGNEIAPSWYITMSETV